MGAPEVLSLILKVSSQNFNTSKKGPLYYFLSYYNEINQDSLSSGFFAVRQAIHFFSGNQVSGPSPCTQPRPPQLGEQNQTPLTRALLPLRVSLVARHADALALGVAVPLPAGLAQVGGRGLLHRVGHAHPVVLLHPALRAPGRHLLEEGEVDGQGRARDVEDAHGHEADARALVLHGEVDAPDVGVQGDGASLDVDDDVVVGGLLPHVVGGHLVDEGVGVRVPGGELVVGVVAVGLVVVQIEGLLALLHAGRVGQARTPARDIRKVFLSNDVQSKASGSFCLRRREGLVEGRKERQTEAEKKGWGGGKEVFFNVQSTVQVTRAPQKKKLMMTAEYRNMFTHIQDNSNR